MLLVRKITSRFQNRNHIRSRGADANTLVRLGHSVARSLPWASRVSRDLALYLSLSSISSRNSRPCGHSVTRSHLAVGDDATGKPPRLVDGRWWRGQIWEGPSIHWTPMSSHDLGRPEASKEGGECATRLWPRLEVAHMFRGRCCDFLHFWEIFPKTWSSPFPWATFSTRPVRPRDRVGHWVHARRSLTVTHPASRIAQVNKCSHTALLVISTSSNDDRVSWETWTRYYSPITDRRADFRPPSKAAKLFSTDVNDGHYRIFLDASVLSRPFCATIVDFCY